MGDYHCEGGVNYRWPCSIDPLPRAGEAFYNIVCYHPNMVKPADYRVIVVGSTLNIYKLVNHWNRVNRIQKSQFYYEVP